MNFLLGNERIKQISKIELGNHLDSLHSHLHLFIYLSIHSSFKCKITCGVCVCVCVCVRVRVRVCICSAAQSYSTLYHLMDYNPPGSSVHGIIQARILGWLDISSSRACSGPRVWTCISSIFRLCWQAHCLPLCLVGGPHLPWCISNVNVLKGIHASSRLSDYGKIHHVVYVQQREHALQDPRFLIFLVFQDISWLIFMQIVFLPKWSLLHFHYKVIYWYFEE